MTSIVSFRTAVRIGVALSALGLALVPASAHADVPVPTPVSPLTLPLLSPSPSPSPSPSSTASPSPLDPVVSQLPGPVASPVREVLGSVPESPAPAPVPAPAPAPVPAPGTVKPNAGTPPQQVGAPTGTGVATFPGLRAGSFSSGLGTSGFPALSAGMRPATLDELFSVPDVVAPVTIVPQAATSAPAPRRSVPAGLPLLAVVVAAVTLAGVGVAHVAALRSRRTSV